MIRAALPILREQETGHILNISAGAVISWLLGKTNCADPALLNVSPPSVIGTFSVMVHALVMGVLPKTATHDSL